jgi:hypothetical protein
MGGGDLLNLLIEKDVFEESFARFYIAEVHYFPAHYTHIAHQGCTDDPGHRAMSQTGVHSSRHQT